MEEPHSNEGVVQLSLKLPSSLGRAVKRTSRELGLFPAEYVRGVLRGDQDPPEISDEDKPDENQTDEGAKKGTSVFVVHGRNDRLRKSLFTFLRAIGLRPIEWRKGLELTGKPSPYVGEVLDATLDAAAAVVVLLTPDDEARLKPGFAKSTDQPREGELSGQPRANVLFEAGMAFGRHPDKTVLVQVGEVRPFSDIGGRHVVHLDNSVGKRQEFITKLRACGCDVDDSDSDWTAEGDFGA